MVFTDEKDVLDRVMVEEEKMLLQEVALFIGQMDQFEYCQLVFAGQEQLQLILAPSPEETSPGADLELLHELDIGLDAGETQLTSSSQSHQYSFPTHAYSFTALNNWQGMNDFINSYFSQYHPYLNTDNSNSAGLIHKEQPWSSFVEAYSHDLLDLHISYILQEHDIAIFSDFIDHYLGLYRCCQIPLAGGKSNGCDFAIMLQDLRLGSSYSDENKQLVGQGHHYPYLFSYSGCLPIRIDTIGFPRSSRASLRCEVHFDAQRAWRRKMLCCWPTMELQFSLGNWLSSSRIYRQVSLDRSTLSLQKTTSYRYSFTTDCSTICWLYSSSICYRSCSKSIPWRCASIRSSACASQAASMSASLERMSASRSGSRVQSSWGWSWAIISWTSSSSLSEMEYAKWLECMIYNVRKTSFRDQGSSFFMFFYDYQGQKAGWKFRRLGNLGQSFFQARGRGYSRLGCFGYLRDYECSPSLL